MAEKKKVTVSVTRKKPERRAESEEPFSLLDLPDEVAQRAREIWLAGLGALATVEEEGARVFERLVEKGAAWERENRGVLGAVRDGTADAAGAAAETAEAGVEALDRRVTRAVEATVEGVLGRLGVPARAEVRDLTRRIEALSAQVEALAERLEA